MEKSSLLDRFNAALSASTLEPLPLPRAPLTNLGPSVQTPALPPLPPPLCTLGTKSSKKFIYVLILLIVAAVVIVMLLKRKKKKKNKVTQEEDEPEEEEEEEEVKKEVIITKKKKKGPTFFQHSEEVPARSHISSDRRQASKAPLEDPNFTRLPI